MDIEFISRDLPDMLAGNPPYNTAISSRTSRVGFNWADVGVVTPPANVYSWNCIMTSVQYRGMSIVGICFKGTLAMSLSGNGKYKTASYSLINDCFVEGSSFNNTTFYKETHSHNGENFTILYMSFVPTESKVSQPNSLWTANDDSFIAYPNIPAFNQTTVNPSLGIRDAIENFLFPSSTLSFDATIRSSSDGMRDNDAIFKVKNWGNIQNLPSGKYPYDYGIGFGAASWGGVHSGKTVGDFTLSSEISWGYKELYGKLTPAEQQEAYSNGYIDAKVYMYHASIVDAYHTVRLFPNGTMTLLSETAPGHLYVYANTSAYDDDRFDDDDGVMIQQVPGQEMSIDNLLTTSYALDDNTLMQFGSWLWDNDLQGQIFENQVAPIENVISCKRIPFDIPNVGDNPKDPDNKVDMHCGNLPVLYGGSPVKAFKAHSTHRFDVGIFKIPTYTGDYLDYENNISIYLPYIGIQAIPSSICYKRTLVDAKKGKHTITAKNKDGSTYTVQVPKVVGRKLGVVYYYDIIYGSCCALLYTESSEEDNPLIWNGKTVEGGNLFAVFNGDCGVDIPVTASNRASNELSLRKTGDNMMTGVIAGAVGGAMAGGIPGAITGAITAGIGTSLNYRAQERNQEVHFTTSGGFSSQIASYMSKTVTVFVEHAVYKKDPENYGHENGYPCNLTLNMRSLRGLGYTELSGECEISGIPCFEEERKALKEALMQGFYISDNVISE